MGTEMSFLREATDKEKVGVLNNLMNQYNDDFN